MISDEGLVYSFNLDWGAILWSPRDDAFLVWRSNGGTISDKVKHIGNRVTLDHFVDRYLHNDLKDTFHRAYLARIIINSYRCLPAHEYLELVTKLELTELLPSIVEKLVKEGYDTLLSLIDPERVVWYYFGVGEKCI